VISIEHRKSIVLQILKYILLTFGAVLMLFPIIWMVSASLKPLSEVMQIPINLIPSKIHWENYILPFQTRPFLRYFFNSFFVATCVTVSNLFFSGLCGYGLAKFNFWGKNFFFFYILSTFMLPIQVIMVPLFLIVKNFGWLNTYQGLIIPLMINAMGVFLMRQYIISIPDDFIDAARIDGANEFMIFIRIIMPLCKPILTALGLFTFMGSWSEFLWPLLVATKDAYRTLPVGLALFQNAYRSTYNQLMAVSFLAMLPLLIIFIFAQRRFIESVALTGLKQ
jgi:multiple sugar transport system permease protein